MNLTIEDKIIIASALRLARLDLIEREPAIAERMLTLADQYEPMGSVMPGFSIAKELAKMLGVSEGKALEIIAQLSTSEVVSVAHALSARDSEEVERIVGLRAC